MFLKKSAVAAGLVLGLLSGAAQAAPITYNVDYSNSDNFGSFTEIVSAVGTITTDGNLGTLSAADIFSYNLMLNGTLTDATGTTNTTATLTQTNSSVTVATNAFQAVGNELIFAHEVTASNILLFSDGMNFLSYTGDANSNSVQVTVGAVNESDGFGPVDLVIGTSGPSTVPLPASAPMFGAALMALGAVGYGMKRKAKAAATV